MWLAYFGLGLQVSIIFHIVSVGSHYPFEKHWVPHFLPNLTHFSRLTPIFTHIFPVFVLCTLILEAFMLRASLLTPILLFLSFGLLVAHQWCYYSYRQWLPDPATTKNWVPGENLSFGPFPLLENLADQGATL